MRRLALVIAPYRTATAAEQQDTRRALNRLIAMGWCPVFLPYALRDVLNDERPMERLAALSCSSSFVKAVASNMSAACFVVGDRYTEGVERDVADWQHYRRVAIETAENIARAIGLAPPPDDTTPRRLTWTDADLAFTPAPVYAAPARSGKDLLVAGLAECVVTPPTSPLPASERAAHPWCMDTYPDPPEESKGYRADHDL